MALPSNNTACGFLDYTVAGYEHTLLVRCSDLTTDGDLIANISAFLDIVGDHLYPWEVTGFRRRDKDANVTYDVPWTGTASGGSGTSVPANTASFYDFVGRDPNGFRVRAAMFGAGTVISNGDYRITPGEASWVGDALDSLVSDANIFLTISGDQPVWKQYANSGVNAYWRNKVR